MCIFKKPKVPAAPVIADPGNEETARQQDQEARLRARRAGAAADILTGPRGIPGTTTKLGGVQ